MFAPVYLDANATTPVAPEVLDAMLPWFGERYGNPSSRHDYGRAAAAALVRAREQVATAVGAHPTEVVFVSCGSEANALFLKGAARFRGKPGDLAIGATEHPSVTANARQLTEQGWRLHELPCAADGVIDAEAARDLARRAAPALWSVMLANNETGVLQDIAALAERVRAETSEPAWFHSDAVQAFGKLPLDFRALNQAGVHALSLSAHKIHGPKGAAALIVDKRLGLDPLIAGGGQEGNLRSGTENVAALVGFGAACEYSMRQLASLPTRLLSLRARLEDGLYTLGATIFGAGTKRLANTTFFAIPGIDGETLVSRLDRAGFALASGAACSSAHPGTSRTLTAMGVPDDLAQGALRLSLSSDNNAEHIDRFLATLSATVLELTSLSCLTTFDPA